LDDTILAANYCLEMGKSDKISVGILAWNARDIHLVEHGGYGPSKRGVQKLSILDLTS